MTLDRIGSSGYHAVIGVAGTQNGKSNDRKELSMSIELPKDAEGREIPLDTEVLYEKDGSELYVKRIEFDPFKKEWSFAVQKDSDGGIVVYRRSRVVYLEKPAPPDSWEKLLEDLNRAIEARNESDSPVCSYANHLDDLCGDCKFHGGGFNCKDKMLVDIASRIRRLRGEN